MKRRRFTARVLIGSLLLGGFFAAARCFGDTPATRPAGAGGQPAVLATPSVDQKPASPKVLVLPFTSIDGADKREWIGKAFDQSVITELSRGPGLQPITLGTAPPAAGYDAAGALAAAREAGATFVIFGTYQMMGQDLRLLGQILTVQSGEAIGGIRLTGPVNELFGIEDALANSVHRQLLATQSERQQPNSDAQARQPAAMDPLRVAPPTRGIAPPPDAAPPDQSALLNGPPNYDYGYGGYGGYSHGGYPSFYGYGPRIYGGFYPFFYGSSLRVRSTGFHERSSIDSGSGLMHLSDGTTQSQGNYNRFPGNYITPINGNTITPPPPFRSTGGRMPVGQTVPPFPNAYHLPLPRVGPAPAPAARK